MLVKSQMPKPRWRFLWQTVNGEGPEKCLVFP
jgi:hypothetical protein